MMGEVGENNQARAEHNVRHPTTSRASRSMGDLASKYDREAFIQLRQVMAFVAAVTGVISAACLSGLPSTACYALADAYAVSLIKLALIFALSIVIFLPFNAVRLMGCACST